MAFEKSLFFLRFLQTAAGAFDRCDVDPADHDFDFLLYRNLLEDFFLCDQSHDLGPDLGFDHRYFGPAQLPGCLADHDGRQTGLFDLHTLLIDNQHTGGLGHGV